jgi:ligand-binding SRPBCC domain-containing protein
LRLEHLHYALRIPIGLSAAWDFFSDPRNLGRMTPPSLAIEITSEPPPRMHPGMIITYTVRPLLGIPVRWVTEITHVREPNLFVDEQRFGPYRFWHHQHHFREVDGGIEISDTSGGNSQVFFRSGGCSSKRRSGRCPKPGAGERYGADRFGTP